MRPKQKKVACGALNLRGKAVAFRYDGRAMRGTVVTHIRDNRWQVASPQLPPDCARHDGSRRVVLARQDFVVQA
jgi:hypothetical protein